MLTKRVEKEVEELAKRWYYIIWVNKADNETEGEKIVQFDKNLKYIPTVMQLTNCCIENLKELGKVKRISKQDREAIKVTVQKVWEAITEQEKNKLKVKNKK